MEIMNNDGMEIQPYGMQCTTFCAMPAVGCAVVACGLSVVGIVISTALAPVLAAVGGVYGSELGNTVCEGN